VVYLLTLIGTTVLGVGWVLQHRVVVACGDTSGGPRLAQMLRSRLWCAGIAALTLGQTLTGTALQLGPLTLVAPLMSLTLMCAFITRAILVKHRPLRREILGSIGVAAALSAFMVTSSPTNTRHLDPRIVLPGVLAVVAIAVVTAALLAQGVRRHVLTTSLTAAFAAGLLYALQDVATRGVSVTFTHHGIRPTLASLWPYVMLAAAAAAVLLSQRAFRAARLDYALAPIAGTQPVIGVVLGVVLLGDNIRLAPASLVIDAVCLLGLIASVTVIARSPALLDDHQRAEASPTDQARQRSGREPASRHQPRRVPTRWLRWISRARSIARSTRTSAP
jgi:uncharacterized membrane protein